MPFSWSVIRPATTEDRARLEYTARRFIKRHAIRFDPVYSDSPLDAIEQAIFIANQWQYPRKSALGRLWLDCVRRALRSKAATGIHLGTVGYEVK